MQEHAICWKCGTLEDILTKCSNNGQKTIWNLAGKAWEKRGMKWKEPNLSLILGCGITGLKHESQEPDTDTPGVDRLYRILISESARLAWIIQNDRMKGEKPQRKKS
ncbi:hypothetical protein L218DRAFT_880621 [Marasmius fiardii PR-910]|nr:hypothetical protein L218DRAFT_880621 [Marasmius fiardii PR-910]